MQLLWFCAALFSTRLVLSQIQHCYYALARNDDYTVNIELQNISPWQKHKNLQTTTDLFIAFSPWQRVFEVYLGRPVVHLTSGDSWILVLSTRTLRFRCLWVISLVMLQLSFFWARRWLEISAQEIGQKTKDLTYWSEAPVCEKLPPSSYEFWLLAGTLNHATKQIWYCCYITS